MPLTPSPPPPNTPTPSPHHKTKGHVPTLDTWELGADGDGLEARVARLLEDAAAAGRATAALPSDALLLQLPPGAGAEEVEAAAARAVAALLPALGWDAARDAQVLSPVRRGPGGVGALNQRLQPLLNPPDPGRPEMPLSATPTANASAAAAAAAAGLPPPAWRVGDRVLQTANDYDRLTWNGDLGYVAAVDAAARRLTVCFPSGGGIGGGGGGGAGDGSNGSGAGGSRDAAATVTAAGGAAVEAADGDAGRGRFLLYSGREIGDQLQLAWATTVHKSQGGEYPVVVLALHRAFGAAMLSRALLYTAMTRARRLLVVVGSRDALEAAAQRAGGDRKQTGLGARLARGAAAAGIARCEPRVFRGGEGGGSSDGSDGGGSGVDDLEL